MVPHELHRPCQRISESENVNVRSAEMHCLHSSLIDVISLPVTVSRTPTVRAPVVPLLSLPAP